MIHYNKILMIKEFQKFKGWQVLEYFLRENPPAGIRELARKLKISTGTVKNYCDVFEESGLLRSEKAGTAKLFSLQKNELVRQWKVTLVLQMISERILPVIFYGRTQCFGGIIPFTKCV